MSAPARVRDLYVIGKHGSYFVPTVAACDKALRELSAGLQVAAVLKVPASTVRRLRADVDAVLDRRTALAFHEAAEEAMRLAREETR